MTQQENGAYRRIRQMIAGEQCVILDGGVATELQRIGVRGYRLNDRELWGTSLLDQAPHAVLDVHRRYVEAGCDVISADTWGILRAPEYEARGGSPFGAGGHWMDMARLGMRLVRQAIDEAGKTGELAAAFTIGGDVDSPKRRETLQLLARVFTDDPPDLILMETLSLIREDLTFPAVELMLETGIPVWLSFRRCRHGVCGVFGQHWGGPEGDLFGRAARKFEAMGVEALLINCLPVDHVPGMLPWLRDFTDLPLGVYPNLGRYLDPGWKFDENVDPRAYAELAREWREEGAQIVGGCCGVTPEHIAAAREALEGTRPGRKRGRATRAPLAADAAPSPARTTYRPWTDEAGRTLYPLPFPEIIVDPGVFRPTQGSFLLWKHLFQTGVGRGQRCLDVGCGSGILTVQLALNGAAQVHGIDIQQEAIANTLANAFRNGVAERVSGEAIDLYTFLPDRAYDLIVASLYQMPVDPQGEITGHRPVDFWGRNLLDHLISLLPDLLADAGVAYVMQISILSQRRTAELLDEAGLQHRVVDFSFFHFSPVFYENLEQIHIVERLSDAYHLNFGEDDVMVMYLLEITH
ncbi:MAG TPA: homocysteine S-methyltransferase family protein [Candidatus Sulfomarinibacteraceae bacterium]|nr:homocysteine S-methyltransferase family protein [Candidatus Sulfomarinibacteraceae bacterium]